MIQTPYIPQEPDVGNLNDFIGFTDRGEKDRELAGRINKKAQEKINLTSTQRPLTREESEFADRQFASLRKEAAVLRSEIKQIQEQIDFALANGTEVTLDITDKPFLKKAVRIVFGYKSNVITYPMYKEVLSLKRAFEKTELKDYLENPK